MADPCGDLALMIQKYTPAASYLGYGVIKFPMQNNNFKVASFNAPIDYEVITARFSIAPLNGKATFGLMINEHIFYYMVNKNCDFISYYQKKFQYNLFDRVNATQVYKDNNVYEVNAGDYVCQDGYVYDNNIIRKTSDVTTTLPDGINISIIGGPTRFQKFTAYKTKLGLYVVLNTTEQTDAIAIVNFDLSFVSIIASGKKVNFNTYLHAVNMAEVKNSFIPNNDVDDSALVKIYDNGIYLTTDKSGRIVQLVSVEQYNNSMVDLINEVSPGAATLANYTVMVNGKLMDFDKIITIDSVAITDDYVQFGGERVRLVNFGEGDVKDAALNTISYDVYTKLGVRGISEDEISPVESKTYTVLRPKLELPVVKSVYIVLPTDITLELELFHISKKLSLIAPGKFSGYDLNTGALYFRSEYSHTFAMYLCMDGDNYFFIDAEPN